MSDYGFPKLMELLQGKSIENEVLGFVDLCGTKSYIKKYLKNELGNLQGHLTRLQTSFSSALLNVSKDNPDINVIQASDGAFIQGKADDVLIAIVKVFSICPFIFNYKEIHPIPMRASIATGLIRVAENQKEIEQIKNFKGYPFWGPAFVKTHLMEKHGRKGLHIFITESAHNLLDVNIQDLVIKDKYVSSVDVFNESKEDYYLYNWCLLLPEIVEEYLKVSLAGQYDPNGNYGEKTLAYFIQAANEWMSSEDEYLKQFGAELLALKNS